MEGETGRSRWGAGLCVQRPSDAREDTREGWGQQSVLAAEGGREPGMYGGRASKPWKEHGVGAGGKRNKQRGRQSETAKQMESQRTNGPKGHMSEWQTKI